MAKSARSRLLLMTAMLAACCWFAPGIRTRHRAEPSDSATRTEELINGVGPMRQIREEWRRIWIENEPHITPERVHGGIQ